MPQNIKLSDIKPLIGNLSRANYYEVQFGGLSSGLSAYLSERGVTSRFVSGDMGLMCYNASLPGASMAKIESSNFSGVVENFAHTQIFTPITLEFYCDDEYRGLKFVRHWQEYITSGNETNTNVYGSPYYNYRVKYPNDPVDGYKSNSTRILKFENNYDRIIEYSFVGLFPLDLASVPVRYGPNSELTRITCSFAYDRMITGSVYSYDFARSLGNNISSIVNRVSNIATTASDIVSLFTN